MSNPAVVYRFRKQPANTFSSTASNHLLQHPFALDIAPSPPPLRIWPLRPPDAVSPRGDLARAPLVRPGAPSSLALQLPHRHHVPHYASLQPHGLGQTHRSARLSPGRRRLGWSTKPRLLYPCFRRDDELVLGLGHSEGGDEKLCRQKEEEKLDYGEGLKKTLGSGSKWTLEALAMTFGGLYLAVVGKRPCGRNARWKTRWQIESVIPFFFYATVHEDSSLILCSFPHSCTLCADTSDPGFYHSRIT